MFRPLKTAHLTDNEGNKIDLPKYFVIGSSSDCHLCIPDESILSHHLIIEQRNAHYFVKSVSSSHPIRLNEDETFSNKLNDGDTLYLSTRTFKFSSPCQEITSPKPTALESLCPRWQKQLENLSNASLSPFPILLLGETGTGKDVLATEIHSLSQRKRSPFVGINCGALSPSLIESELFGHVRGSFTGATQDRKGAFETARGGTLFLDEIGDLPLSLQPKLLRALENNEIRPVGSDRARKTDVRVISATHQNIEELISEGKFRLDLYHRLNILSFTPPPLRERLKDFDSLTYTFAKDFRVRFSVSAIDEMKKHYWPGNIRELKNFIARLSALYPGQHITNEHIEDQLCTQDEFLKAHQGAKKSVSSRGIEKEMILRSLSLHSGNQRKTAEALGIPKSTLHDRIKTYRIDPKNMKLVSASA